MEGLTFDAENHIYYFDGEKKPGVTEITSVYGIDSDEDDSMYANQMERAADRGVTCHSVIESLLTGQEDIEFPSIYAEYVDGIRLFLAEHQLDPIMIERMVYSKEMQVAGTFDLLSVEDDLLILDDWKFVSSVCKPKVKAQLNGYNKILNELGIFPDKLRVIQFLPGTYRPYWVTIDGSEWDAALQVYQYKNRKFGRGVID